MNSVTGTPVNTVWFCCTLSILLGLLSFAGAEAIGAVFNLSIVGIYIAYSIPIAARFIFENNHRPGPFDLGKFVSKKVIH
jgi:amino acid transporter